MAQIIKLFNIASVPKFGIKFLQSSTNIPGAWELHP